LKDGRPAKDCACEEEQSKEESHQVNAECISCSFKGSIEVKKGKKIYEMSCSEFGNKTLKKRRKSHRVKGHDR